MTCWKCGQPLADGANFCWKCGANMKDTPTPVPETSPELSESPESREPSPAPVQESFPETRNHLACNEKLKQICQKENLPYQELAEPFRWSEDYGYYTKEVPGCFFGIGDGKGYPQIHTENYCFPDEILPTAAAIFLALAKA